MNKKIIFIVLFFLISFPYYDTFAQYSGTSSNSKTTKVKQYKKKDGTVVKSHRRTKINSYNLDNFKAKGNYNPYSGKVGKKKYKNTHNSLYKPLKSKNNFKNSYSSKTYKLKSFKIKSKSYRIKTYKPKSYKKSYKYKW